MTQSGPQLKGEPKTYKKNQFCTTEGALFLGHAMENNAKMACMLRRIFPSPFKRAQYIGLQQGGELDGAILCSAPSVFEISCGESPVQDVAGVWYAENGDINIHAPKGRIRLSAESIDLISIGDGDKTGYVNVRANAYLDVEASKIKMEADQSFSTDSETMDINTSGKTEIDCGSWKIIEGGDALTIPGQGNITLLQWPKAMAKLVGDLI